MAPAMIAPITASETPAGMWMTPERHELRRDEHQQHDEADAQVLNLATTLPMTDRESAGRAARRCSSCRRETGRASRRKTGDGIDREDEVRRLDRHQRDQQGVGRGALPSIFTTKRSPWRRGVIGTRRAIQLVQRAHVASTHG
jgi:hypothetical protein